VEDEIMKEQRRRVLKNIIILVGSLFYSTIWAVYLVFSNNDVTRIIGAISWLFFFVILAYHIRKEIQKDKEEEIGEKRGK